MMVKQERAARTRQALIRSAAEVFAEQGFARASVSAISLRAGVSNGALHFHFASKGALADAVQQEAVGAMRRMTENAEAVGGPLQAVVEATHGLVRQLGEDAVLRAGFSLCGRPEGGPGPADAARRGVSPRREWQTWVEEMLGRAEAEALLAHGVSPRGAAEAIVAATVGFEVLGGQDRSWLDAGTVTRFWELMLPPLSAPR
ncbi:MULTISPECIES: ScbR family autoregulator-binding transcription factor [Streptomyces]|uniref:ScbR family autoregulator-binding transcription factor n=1 Tax=Streptomyces TaxID=1883 RepID=UPI002F919F19|nr:TetR/AcrR family transcriptional regulator [Streptomyces albidoflavus]